MVSFIGDKSVHNQRIGCLEKMQTLCSYVSVCGEEREIF